MGILRQRQKNLMQPAQLVLPPLRLMGSPTPRPLSLIRRLMRGRRRSVPRLIQGRPRSLRSLTLPLSLRPMLSPTPPHRSPRRTLSLIPLNRLLIIQRRKRMSTTARAIAFDIIKSDTLTFCFTVRLIGKPLHTFPDALQATRHLARKIKKRLRFQPLFLWVRPALVHRG